VTSIRYVLCCILRENGHKVAWELFNGVVFITEVPLTLFL
jgi:hypothetical protein